MNTENKPDIVKNDIVVTLDYELRVDGEIVDSSEHGDPIVYLQGAGSLVPGLENELLGMKIGESKKVTVSPTEGYGEVDEDGIVEVPRDEFPEDFPLEPGLEITVSTGEEDSDEFDEEDMMEAFVVEFNEETVTLDFNHPLAGKELHFDVKIVDMRFPTEEELEHGHVHEDLDFYFDEEDFEDTEDPDNHHH